MKVSTENDNNFGYEKITILVDNIPLIFHFTFINISFFSGWHNRLNTSQVHPHSRPTTSQTYCNRQMLLIAVFGPTILSVTFSEGTPSQRRKQSTWYQYMEGEVITIHQWSRNCLPFRSTRVHPGVTRSLVLCACFVDHCFSFWSQCFLFLFDTRILITSLVSSNSSYQGEWIRANVNWGERIWIPWKLTQSFRITLARKIKIGALDEDIILLH